MILRDLRKRGLKPWRCTIADGHLGLWAALGEPYPTLAEHWGWNHKMVNVLDALLKKQQAEVRTLLCAMPRRRQHARHCGSSSPLVTTRWLPRQWDGWRMIGIDW